MRHMWPRTPCAYCGTRCGENMPCHSVQCAPYEHSLSTKNYTKIVTFNVWLFLGLATYMHAKLYFLCTALNPTFYGRIFLVALKKMLLTTWIRFRYEQRVVIYVLKSLDISEVIPLHWSIWSWMYLNFWSDTTERIWSNTTERIWSHTTERIWSHTTECTSSHTTECTRSHTTECT